MHNGRFGVGLVGVQPGRSWAAIAHIPALRALSKDYEIVGVANTSYESAARAAAACGITRAFASVQEMVSSPDVDIVVVTVKVPGHAEIVNAALDAGKAVYCEWPIGNGVAEARAMAEKAKTLGIVAVAGTQARAAPVMRYAKALVSEGYVGEVLSSTLVGSGMNWGSSIEEVNAYTLDASNGANMLTIPFGHTMAAVADVLGPIDKVSAILATRRKLVRVIETEQEVPMTAPDQVLMDATLASGAPFSVHYRGGMPRGVGLMWEINGSDGDLQITGFGGHAQFVPLSIKGGRGSEQGLTEMTVPAPYASSLELDMFATNVGLMYQLLAADLRNGTSTAPRFGEALLIHELIAAVELSAIRGRQVEVKDMG